MQRFWMTLSIALALAAPPAFAGKLDAVTQAAKTYVAKKETTGGGNRGLASSGQGKAGRVLSQGKKLTGK